MPYGLVDCNNFFVSCERVFRPELNNKPVVVLSNNDGCVVSRSNEAKAMKIPMGMPFYQLKEFDKNNAVTAFSSNYVLYGDMSHRVMSILSNTVGNIIPYSIDESFFAIDNYAQLPHTKAVALAKNIHQSTGIPVSIGIAPTKTLAKVACKFAKKLKGYKSACIINTDEKRLKALQLTAIEDIWGIGRRTIPSLKQKGIVTAADFLQLSEKAIRREFGLPLAQTWKELNGIDCIDIEKGDNKQSICTSRSFAQMVDSEEQLQTHIANFAAQCATKLRQQHSAAQSVMVFIASNRFRTDLQQYSNACTQMLEVAASNTYEIVAAASLALHKIFKKGVQYKKAGVILCDICPANAIQTSMFDENQYRRDKDNQLSAIIDSINKANGRDTICLAAQLSGPNNNISNQPLFNNNLRREHLSERYTTNWNELLKVK